MRMGLHFYGIFALFTLLLFPPHELAHYMAYRVLGVSVRLTLNTASPNDPTRRNFGAELAGPALNLLVAAAAMAVFRRVQKGRQWWAALALAAAMARLVVYAIVVGAAVATGSGLSMGNDEPIAAHLVGLPSLTFVGLLTPLFAVIVWNVLRAFDGTGSRKALYLTGLALTVLCLGLLVGHVTDPLLFPRPH